jgi:hypothetical protein
MNRINAVPHFQPTHNQKTGLCSYLDCVPDHHLGIVNVLKDSDMFK